LLGKLRVASVTRRDIEDFQNAVAAGKTARRVKLDKARAVSNVRGGRGTATRTMGLLGAVFEFAVARGWRKDNPVRGIRRAADGRRERRLTDDEFKKLGAALAAAAEKAKVWPPAIAAIRFLAVTGWRRGEALDLTHDAVDVGKRIAVLADTKTGRSVRPLSQAAVDVIRAQTVEGDLVFPASRGEGTLSGFQKYWQRIVHAGGLPADVTAHVLRHSFASVAADLGYSEATIANLIGHRGHSITSRYIHSADALLLAAADAVAGRIMELMQ
jgi:integrase